MIDLTRGPAAPLHLAHATMNFGPNKGRAGELLALLDAAIADGADITPRHLPVPARRDHAVGDAAELGVGRRRRGHPRPAAGPGRARPDPRAPGGHRLRRLPRRDRRVGHASRSAAFGTPSWTKYVGRTIAEIAEYAETATRLTSASTSCIRDELGTGDPAARRPRGERAGDHAPPRHTGGSDGLLVGAQAAPARLGHLPPLPRPLQPRAGHALGWRSASATSPAAPRRRLRLRDRGLVRTGYAADLVLFDPDTVADTRDLRRAAAACRRHPATCSSTAGRRSPTAHSPATGAVRPAPPTRRRPAMTTGRRRRPTPRSARQPPRCWRS